MRPHCKCYQININLILSTKYSTWFVNRDYVVLKLEYSFKVVISDFSCLQKKKKTIVACIQSICFLLVEVLELFGNNGMWNHVPLIFTHTDWNINLW